MKISLGRKWKLSLTKASSAQVIPNNDVPLPLQMNRLPDESSVSKKFQLTKKNSISVTAKEYVLNLAVNGHERKGELHTGKGNFILHLGENFGRKILFPTNRLPESFVSKKFQPNKKNSNSVSAIEFVKTLAVNGHERKGELHTDEGNHLAFWISQNFTDS